LGSKFMEEASISACLARACETSEEAGREAIALWLASEGGESCWILAERPLRVAREGSSVASLHCHVDTFVKIAQKELTLTKAVMRGKLQVKGKQSAVKGWRPVLALAMKELRGAAAPGLVDEKVFELSTSRGSERVAALATLKKFRIEATLRRGTLTVKLNGRKTKEHDDKENGAKLDSLRKVFARAMGVEDSFEEMGGYDASKDFFMAIALRGETFHVRAKAKHLGLHTNTSFLLPSDATFDERREATDLVFKIIACLATVGPF